jgi:hypothetical protein
MACLAHNPSRRKLTGVEKRVYDLGHTYGEKDAKAADVGLVVHNDTHDIRQMFNHTWERMIPLGEARASQESAMWPVFERGYYDGYARRRNPIFLPKSLFDSYIVKSDGGEVNVDRIQTLKGAEKKVHELAGKYPCVGFSILSAKHGTTIKHYEASVGRGAPRVDKDNSQAYKREATKEARDAVRFRLFVNGSEYADYETKQEAEKVGKKEAGGGGKWKVKQVAVNPFGDFASKYMKYFKMLDRLPSDYDFDQLRDYLVYHSERMSRGDANDVVEAWLRSRKKHHNPMTGVPSYDIPLERHHGRSQRQAVAMALAEQRRVSGNPVVVSHGKAYNVKNLGWLRSHWKDIESITIHEPSEKQPGMHRDTAMVAKTHDGKTYTAFWYDTDSATEWLDRLPTMRDIPRHVVRNNPVEIFTTRNEAQRFASRTIGATVIPAQSGGYVVVYPLGGRSGRNPTAGHIEPGTLPKVHYSMGQSNASVNRSMAMKALKAGMTPEEIHTEWPRIWSLSDGKLAQIYDSEFASHPGVYETKYTMANVPEIIARYKKAKKAKRNPATSELDAADLYETFHGEPSEETIEYHVEEFERVDWATLGDLIQLKVETTTGKLVELNAPDPGRSSVEQIIKLVASPDGKQLAFVGGDQAIDVNSIGFGDKDVRDLMVIGLVCEFTYQTQKAFDNFETTDYYHEAGEEHPVKHYFDDFRRKPTLLYSPYDQTMKLAGGLYQVKDVGVVN